MMFTCASRLLVICNIKESRLGGINITSVMITLFIF